MEYIGDLATTKYSHNLQSKYLLVPALHDVSEAHHTDELYKNMTVRNMGSVGSGTICMS